MTVLISDDSKLKVALATVDGTTCKIVYMVMKMCEPHFLNWRKGLPDPHSNSEECFQIVPFWTLLTMTQL